MTLSNLSQTLPYPQTPWKISSDLSQRLQPKGKRYKAALLQPTDPEAAFIQSYFMQDKPPGYSISKVTCIYNRSLHLGFLAHLMNIEEEAQKFHPTWEKEDLPLQRKKVIERWKGLVDSFSPLICTIEDETETLHHAKVLFAWHGTNTKKAESICEGGFTYFGKHLGPGKESTDIGFFGSGIYFTPSAQYATMYSQEGVLLLSCVSMRPPYPIVSNVAHPQKCQDMITLEGKGAYKNYDAHMAPVASIYPDNPYCMMCFPCFEDQAPDWDEIVVFQKAQTLPAYVIELSPDFVYSPTTHYTPELCYAACKAGNKPQLQAWIAQDRNRLYVTNSQGENLLFAAIHGNQLALLKWLHTQDLSLITNSRKDGWSLMHLAAAQGHIKIVMWLNTKDPNMIHSQAITPLHLAAFYEQIDILRLFLPQLLQNTSLIEEIAQRPNPQTLNFLLKNGLDPNQTNSFKQTLLHLAAHTGQVSNIDTFLENGADINAQDLSQKTPLYHATAQGHISAVKYLLERGADPTILGIEGDTVLHVAAFYGYTPLLQGFLTRCPQLLHIPDHDGKHPIHKAVWMHPKPDIVQLLLEHGANPNATNKFGYTPLHWAAKHGHIQSAQLLLQAGAQIDAINQNQDLPFDLAIKWGQDTLVHFFLKTTPPQDIDPLPKDIEGYYSKQLLQAKREEHPYYQIFYLERLSDHYAQKQNWSGAAKLLNAALAILEKECDNPLFQKYLLARLERLEALFLESQRQKVPYQHKGAVSNYRTWLTNIRAEYVQQFESIQDTLYALTNSYKKLLGSLILDAQELLGPAPTQWACIGMGSMGRDEMCPYSDLEFAFVIKRKTPETLQYFRTLSRLIELKIINLGETKFPIFAPLFGQSNPKASPTPGGFSLDTGGNAPLGKPGHYELIDTPTELAQYQSEKWMTEDIIVTNALSSTCFIAGSQTLAAKYDQAKEAALNITDGFFSFTGTPFRYKFALKLLEGNIHEFKPNLTQEKQETAAFGIKKELYRPLQSILGSLKLFYGLQSTSTFAIIKELLNKGILSSEGAKNLTQALAKVLTLRFEAHNFYKNEEEFLLHIDKEQDPHYLYLTEERLEPLHEIYKVLIPLCLCAEEFTQNQNSKSFNVKLYDDSPTVQAAAFDRTLQYTKAQEAAQQAVSLNPNDIDRQLELGYIESKMGKSREALLRNREALVLAQKKHGGNHPSVAKCYNNIGAVYAKLGKYTEALEHFEKALMIQLQILDYNHPDIATSYNNVGTVYDRLHEYTKALEYYEMALKIRLQVLDKDHPNIAANHSNIGHAYSNFGEHAKALEHQEKALEIQLRALGYSHPSVAIIYCNIGGIYRDLRENTQALEYFENALKSCLQVLGHNHPNVATIHNNIGGVYHDIGEYKKALVHYEEALMIQLQVLDHNHPDLAISYNSIGIAYNNLREYTKALEHCQKALIIWLQAYGKNHPNIELGLTWLIDCAKKAHPSNLQTLKWIHQLCIQVLGNDNRLVQELTQLL